MSSPKVLKSRREAREWAVQFLFQRDFNDLDRETALADFWEAAGGDEAQRAFAEELIKGVEMHRSDLDQQIEKYAEHWTVKRMGAVDRNVMRVAMYEMLHRDDIPPIVSINEAVDIAKALSNRDSGKFVNGILDRASKDLDRPRRASSDRKKSATTIEEQ